MRQDADNFVRLAVERDRTAYDAGVGVEAAAPEVVAQDHDMIATHLIVLERKRSSQLRLNAEQ